MHNVLYTFFLIPAFYLYQRIKMGPHSTKHDNSGDSSTTDVLLNENENVVEQTINNDTIDSVSSDIKESGPVYYAVYIPLDTIPAADMSDCSTTIFEDRIEALKLVKKYKKARFKAFSCFVEATQFAINGMGLIPQNMITANHEQNSSESIETFVNNVLNLSVGEKPSPFKGPKSQDFVKLRKAIENDDFISVQKTISDNPRYLVSYGDTPAILQEGSRYNALHVCARTNRAAICSFILNTISNVGFILRLYGGDSTKDAEAAHERCNVLLDLYLNTPDKGCNETPLHFAVKYGSVDVVKVLMTYPQCDKTRPNKFGQTPKEIICSRVSGSGDNGDLYKKISALLEEQYYVPVLRSEDPSIQPTIGQPFSPSKPLKLSGDVVSPAMEIQGLAGPMPLDSARAFRRKWKTPPRDPKSPVSPILKAILQDTDKGLEKVGRELADENQVTWTEFWPFLNTFTDFRTEQGLQLLENFLLQRFKDMTVVSRFDNFCTNKEEKSKAAEGSDVMSSNVDNSAKSQQSPSAFKKSKTPTRRSKPASSSSSSLTSASKTCSTSDYLSYKLSSLSLENERSGSPKSAVSAVTSPSSTQQNHDGYRERYNGIINNSEDSNLGISPHLYVEKSCQVFARRITEGLLQFPESPSETIASEIGYITMLVVSCREDARFAAVDFSRLHSHLASCILQRFNSNEETEELAKSIDIILSRGQDLEDYSSEEEFTGPRSNIAREKDNRKQKICIHKGVGCIAKQISNRMSNFNCNFDERSSVNSSSINSNDQNNQEPPSTEEQCMRLWKSANSCDCVWSLQPFPRLRQSFRRNNHSSISRRIDFSTSPNKEEKRNNDNEIRNCPNSVDKPVTDCCEESAGEESDTSDADSNEFFTPPTSPRTQMSLASSEDDLEMESPDEGPDVYIEGDTPTSIDKAVLDALGQKELDPAIYPNICRWKHLVMLHTPAQRERWPTPHKLRFVKHQNIDTSYYDRFFTKKDLERLRQNDF